MDTVSNPKTNENLEALFDETPPETDLNKINNLRDFDRYLFEVIPQSDIAQHASELLDWILKQDNHSRYAAIEVLCQALGSRCFNELNTLPTKNNSADKTNQTLEEKLQNADAQFGTILFTFLKEYRLIKDARDKDRSPDETPKDSENRKITRQLDAVLGPPMTPSDLVENMIHIADDQDTPALQKRVFEFGMTRINEFANHAAIYDTANLDAAQNSRYQIDIENANMLFAKAQCWVADRHRKKRKAPTGNS